MDRKEVANNTQKVDFVEIVKRAYERGINETEITVEKLIEDLKADLKPLVVG